MDSKVLVIQVVEHIWNLKALNNILIAWLSVFLRAKERIAAQKGNSLIPEIDRNAKIQESHRHIRVCAITWFIFSIYFQKKKNLIYLWISRTLLITAVKSAILGHYLFVDLVPTPKWSPYRLGKSCV